MKGKAPGRIWILRVAPGVPSGGPAFVYSATEAKEWHERGWVVEGPYVLEAELDKDGA